MSDTSRGSSYVNRIERLLNSKGYLTTKAPKSVVWIRKGGGAPFPITTKEDFFHCLDLIGFHANRYPALVQVTTVKNRAARRKKVEENLARLAEPVLHIGDLDILVFAWGKWEKRGYGFVVERWDGFVVGDERKPVWEEFWSEFAEDGFISSKDAPAKPDNGGAKT